MQPSSPSLAINNDTIKPVPKTPPPTLSFDMMDGGRSKWDVKEWEIDMVVDRAHFFTHAKRVFQAREKGRITEFHHVLLYTIGEYKAINEQQLRRLMKSLTGASNTRTTNRVRDLELWGLVEKRRFRGERPDPNENYPCIITLTDMAKEYLYYTTGKNGWMGSSNFFTSPYLPIHLIGTNEIRLQLTENQALGQWLENPPLDYIGRVPSIGEVKISLDESIFFLIERVTSMAKDVHNFLKTRIRTYIQLAKEGKVIFPHDFVLLFIVPSNKTITDIIQHYKVRELHQYFVVCFLSHEELFSPVGFRRGIIQLGEDKLERLYLPI